MKTVYAFTMKNRQGQEVTLSNYQDKVLSIVNTATGCLYILPPKSLLKVSARD